MNSINIERMRYLLRYAPEVESGLVWGITLGRHIVEGRMAGCKNSRGLFYVQVDNQSYQAHRLVWAVVMGEDPSCQIDHVKGKEAGNHIENLRLAPRNQLDNGQNIKKRAGLTSKYLGVSWDKHRKKWIANIQVSGKYMYLGGFDTEEEAYSAYLEAKAKLHTFNPKPREEQ